MLPHHSTAFLEFIEPAREKSQLWRTLLGFVLIAAAFLGITVLLIISVIFFMEQKQLGMGYALVAQLQQGQTIFATLASLGMIALVIPPLWLVMRFLHKRPLRSLISPSLAINWSQWRTGAFIVLTIGSISAAITFATTDVTQQMPIGTWLLWTIPTLILLFLQTTAEELFFRGYLLQQLATHFKSRWIWWVLPALIFGSLHYNPTIFGDNAWYVVASTVLMGLILADITTRFGSLSAAMGLHFANNLVVMIFLNSAGQLSGISLFLYETNLRSPDFRTAIFFSMATTLFGYGIFLMIMRRRRL
ncbi:MAG: lysostaphin resistance A-like protein [Alphaproteobacteria bacterium]